MNNCRKCGKELTDGRRKICEECAKEEQKEKEERKAQKAEQKKQNESSKKELKEKKEKKLSKESIVVISFVAAIFILAIIAILCFSAIKNVGNTIGNIRNYGYATVDGNYIYYITNNTIYIVKADELKLETKLDFSVSDEENERYYPSELFIKDNKLIVIGNFIRYSEETEDYTLKSKIISSNINTTKAYIYDIEEHY